MYDCTIYATQFIYYIHIYSVLSCNEAQHTKVLMCALYIKWNQSLWVQINIISYISHICTQTNRLNSTNELSYSNLSTPSHPVGQSQNYSETQWFSDDDSGRLMYMYSVGKIQNYDKTDAIFFFFFRRRRQWSTYVHVYNMKTDQSPDQKFHNDDQWWMHMYPVGKGIALSKRIFFWWWRYIVGYVKMFFFLLRTIVVSICTCIQ